MKTYSVLFLWAMVALFGRTHARVASDVSVISRTGDSATCLHEAGPNTTAPSILLKMQHECYKPSTAFVRSVSTAPNITAYRALFQAACAQEASVRSCIANVSVEAAACLDELETKMFATVRDFLEHSITATCADSSEVVARIYGEELKLMSLHEQLRVLGCVRSITTTTNFNDETDLPAYTMRRYRAMQTGRSCILDVARSRQRKVEEFDRFAEDLISGSKCIDADTQKVVLCRTLHPETDLQSL